MATESIKIGLRIIMAEVCMKLTVKLIMNISKFNNIIHDCSFFIVSRNC